MLPTSRLVNMPGLSVRDVMDAEPVCVSPQATIQSAITAMNERRIGSVMVTGSDGELLGIFSERDMIRRVVSAVLGWRDYRVSDWMTPNPHIITPEVGWEEAVERMQRLSVRHLPVIDEANRVIGIVSTRLLMDRREDYLSRRVEAQTAELRAANEQLLARDSEVMFNLQAAGQIQTRALLPTAPPDWPELRWAVHYSPLDHLGGDYYDFTTPTPDQLGFLIADASGHSIPAAFVSVMTWAAFAVSSMQYVGPGDVLGAMNRRLSGLAADRFVTAFYGVMDRRSGQFRYASAGHPQPLHWQARTTTIAPLASQGFLLGVMPDEVYVEKTSQLEPGDRVVFYTDGVTEARNEIGEMFGTQRLREALHQSANLGASGILDGVLQQLEQFCGTALLTDDVTLTVMEVAP